MHGKYNNLGNNNAKHVNVIPETEMTWEMRGEHVKNSSTYTRQHIAKNQR